MVLSRFLLNVSYNRVHLASAAVVLGGFGVLVAADTLCTARGGSAPSPAPLMGDLLAVTAACLYATSNVLQERLLIAAPAVEVLAAFGILGAGIAGLQCAVLESHALATSVTWDASFVGPLFGFALAMFCIYTIAPIALSNAGSAGFNLHMLSSDLWSAAARAVLFGGFGGACGGIGFAAALVTVAAGLGLFSAAPAPKRGMLALDSGEQLTEVSGEEVSHELNVET
jgi:solute carrier family 35 protein F1/2